MPLEALIFDVDGTLAETEEVHRQAFNETFPDYGLDWHWTVDDYRELLKTTGGKERIRAHAKTIGVTLDDEMVKKMHVQKTARYGEIIAEGNVGLRPGIGALIADAHANGVRVAIATTTNRPNVDILIKAVFGHPAEEVFEAIAAGDEVAHKKPAPDVFELALARLGLAADRCVAFEDSRNGLISARGAGLRTLVSPSRYTLGEDFDGAIAVVDDFGGHARVKDIEALLA